MSDRQKYVTLMIIWITTLSVISCTMIIANESARISLDVDDTGKVKTGLETKIHTKKGLVVE